MRRRARTAPAGPRPRLHLAASCLFALLPGCGGVPAPAMPPPPVLAIDTGVFVLAQDGDSIGVERFARGTDSLHAELEMLDQLTLVTDARLRPDASVVGLEIRVYGPGGPAGEPLQSSAARFRDGGVLLEQPIGAYVDGPIRIGRGAVPYLNPSAAWLEQVLRRARMLGESPARVPLWVPGEPPGSVARVEFDGNAASIRLDGVLIRAATDAAGRLLHAVTEDRQLEITRR